MAEEDEDKTAFHTSQRVYYYTKMPFGLKNARATYQRLVDKAFKKQIGRDIPRPRRKHERNQSMPKKVRGDHKVVVPKDEERGNQCSLVSGKRLEVDADLFCLPYITSSGNQLQLNGKSGTGSGTCLKKAKKILPGAHGSGRHRSTNQANLVVT
ncbi:hypothetical protein Tco_1577872 [Tanacetum coccineum]